MEKSIIKVRFHTPVDGQYEYYFTSLAAIFDRFSTVQIGCSLRTLWDYGVTADCPKATRNCVISRHSLFSKPQMTPKSEI